MSATITESLKKQLVQELYNDVADSASNYYIGIGRSETWDSADSAPTNAGARRDVNEFRLSLQSVKQAEDVSFVIPRANWTNGTVYNAYNDDITGIGTNDYYVLTDANAVYICLEQGKDASGTAVSSTIEPTGTASTSQRLSDGYVWKFLYTLSSEQASKYLSANYMPVKLQGATDSSSLAVEIEQKAVQDAAVVGQIGSINLLTNGTGYASAPTVVIDGDGSGASATATLSGSNVVKVTLDSDSSGVMHGSGYTYATIRFTGGSPSDSATAQAVLAPVGGFGADPRDDLKSTGIMFNTKPAGSESDDFIVGNDFRQIGLLKNISHDDSAGLYSDATGMALSTLKFATVTTAFTADKTITGGTSGAQAIVDKFDSDTLYYHQNHTTGFTDFDSGETVTEVSGSGSGTLDSADTFLAGDINPHSGTVLYMENRAAVDRASDQTEDIKLVIEF